MLAQFFRLFLVGLAPTFPSVTYVAPFREYPPWLSTPPTSPPPPPPPPPMTRTCLQRPCSRPGPVPSAQPPEAPALRPRSGLPAGCVLSGWWPRARTRRHRQLRPQLSRPRSDSTPLSMVVHPGCEAMLWSDQSSRIGWPAIRRHDEDGIVGRQSLECRIRTWVSTVHQW